MPQQPAPPGATQVPTAGATTVVRQESWWNGQTDAVKIGIVAAVAILVLLMLGGGAKLLTSGSSSAPVPPPAAAVPTSESASAQGIQAIPVNSASNPFTPPVAEDAKDVPPVETSAPTEVSADQVGLYGGSKQENVCDKTKMITYLKQNVSLGQAWSRTIGVDYSQMESYINSTTSTLLRSDTVVTNHGYENSQVTEFTSVLQAGTAVLVNQYGAPVVRCYCGNPLTAAPPTYYPPTYSTPPWRWWNPSSVTIIKQTTTIINKFTFVNIYKPSETYTVPAGSNNPTVPKTTSPSPTPTRIEDPAPEPEPTRIEDPAPEPEPQQHYTKQDAINYWHAQRAKCSDDVFTFVHWTSQKEYAIDQGGGEFDFVIDSYPPNHSPYHFAWRINLNTGSMIPTSPDAQQGARECSLLSIR